MGFDGHPIRNVYHRPTPKWGTRLGGLFSLLGFESTCVDSTDSVGQPQERCDATPHYPTGDKTRISKIESEDEIWPLHAPRRIEPLEERRLLAIVWTNEFSNNFSTIYGTNSAIATQLVNRAIDNWEAVITDFNYDGDNNPLTNNTYNLTVTAGDLGGTGRGSAGTTFSSGLPTQATVTLDNNGGGAGWFFDQTPLDDAEFTAVANSNSATGSAFQATFVDIVNPLVDFYRTIVHEIGHAMGLASTSPVFSVANPMMTLVGSDPFGGSLYSFHDPSGPYGVTATITTNGGRHLYEVNHPNELMNPGRITPIGSPPETTRQFISDFIVQLLVDAYGYTHVLPSQLDTAHVTLDSKTGTLLVQGRAGSLNDTITITTEGASNETIKVVVNGTTERVATAHVTQIVIARNGGSDTISVAPSLASLRKDVDFVVSTNQDSANAGTLGDGLVDLDEPPPAPKYLCAPLSAIQTAVLWREVRISPEEITNSPSRVPVVTRTEISTSREISRSSAQVPARRLSMAAVW